ncbi:hypothetical protein ACGFX8_35900 [Streptomyces sp. NPDC048362]|uniref:hypothetical protein n=1 Tax=Streptomyces sp. NPDC048362 TaxID=3365539 RepID=UPI0037162F12
MNAPETEFTDSGWVAITRNQRGRIGVKPVRMFELGPQGVTALTKNADGVMVPDPDVVEVIKTDELHAAKLAAMHELMEMTERATSRAQFEVLERAADWVMTWEPSRG